MPVRSLRSLVLRWPDRDLVHAAVKAWAQERCRTRPGVIAVGYFGSYARGDWGPGSDVDVVVVVNESGMPFWQRGAEWDTGQLPVPGDVIVYTKAEWARLGGRMGRVLREETVWVYQAAAS